MTVIARLTLHVSFYFYHFANIAAFVLLRSTLVKSEESSRNTGAKLERPLVTISKVIFRGILERF